jgi:hypothetical protein
MTAAVDKQTSVAVDGCMLIRHVCCSYAAVAQGGGCWWLLGCLTDVIQLSCGLCVRLPRTPDVCVFTPSG